MVTAQVLFLIVGFQIFGFTDSKIVTISNTKPRQYLNGNIVDAHDGNIVQWTPILYAMDYVKNHQEQTNPMDVQLYIQTCGFEYNQSINLYTSANLTVWKY